MRYRIEQYEIWAQTYMVEADNKAEAIQKLFDGDGEAIDDTLEYVEVCDDHGISLDEGNVFTGEEVKFLQDELMVEGYVPSIRDISEVKE